MSKPKWVTDKDALDTIWAIRGFLPGDEVRIRVCPQHELTVKGNTPFGQNHHRAIAVIVGYESADLVEIAVDHDEWFLERAEFDAWRRL
jgi:hypothetical protein